MRDLHLRCPEPIHAAVMAEAKKEDLTPSEWVREAIRIRLREVGLNPPFWNERKVTPEQPKPYRMQRPKSDGYPGLDEV